MILPPVVFVSLTIIRSILNISLMFWFTSVDFSPVQSCYIVHIEEMFQPGYVQLNCTRRRFSVIS